MGRWKKGERVFPVRVSFNPRRGHQVNVPRPLMERFGNPEAITFRLSGKKVVVEPGYPSPDGKRKKSQNPGDAST